MLDWLVRDGKDFVFKQNSGYSVKKRSYPPAETKRHEYEMQCVAFVFCQTTDAY